MSVFLVRRHEFIKILGWLRLYTIFIPGFRKNMCPRMSAAGAPSRIPGIIGSFEGVRFADNIRLHSGMDLIFDDNGLLKLYKKSYESHRNEG